MHSAALLINEFESSDQYSSLALNSDSGVTTSRVVFVSAGHITAIDKIVNGLNKTWSAEQLDYVATTTTGYGAPYLIPADSLEMFQQDFQRIVGAGV